MIARFKLAKGLDIAMAGTPAQRISSGPGVNSVALVGTDFADLHPRILVEPGQQVRLGEPLLIDKRNPAIQFVSPGSGTVTTINRGYRRSLQSVVIELDESSVDEQRFPVPETQDQTALRNWLLRSGTWTSLRTRPFDRIPDPSTSPDAIFVTAMDTRPLAADPVVVIDHYADEFARGMHVIANLAAVPVYLCTGPDWAAQPDTASNIKHCIFTGPHPAGLPGTHMHYLYPVSAQRQAWHINYQHVIAIGHLARTGSIMTERVVALGGAGVNDPRLIVTRPGANLTELISKELAAICDYQVISGSVLDGFAAESPRDFLGHYHNQVSVLADYSESRLWGWYQSGFGQRSNHLSRRPDPASSNAPTNAQHGRKTAMLATERFERVLPLDLLPAPLLRALLVKDTDSAQALGCLELAEDDLALCSYVCPAKQDYGTALRTNLSELAELVS